MKSEIGKLYVVATPIGNLKDITLRAIEVLAGVDFILCEDTRISARLLNHYQIKKPLLSFHQHSREKKIEEILHRIIEGESAALITDSGTPGISDPGAKLVRIALESDRIKIVSIPGPSALTAALSISGASSKNIVFFGFLPHKKGRNKTFELMKKDLDLGRVIVFYESPYRIKKTLETLKKFTPEARIVLARELTKKFEEIIYNKIDEVEIDKIITKGEFTIVI